MDIILVILIGGITGYIFKSKSYWRKPSGIIQQAGLIFLLASMGASIGMSESTIESLPLIGLKAFIYAVFNIMFSILIVYIMVRKFFKNSTGIEERVMEHNRKGKVKINYMTLTILGSVAVGIIGGYFIIPYKGLPVIENVSFYSLRILLFLVGMDMGGNNKLFKSLKNIGFRVLIIPFSIIIGSIAGSLVAGTIFSMKVNESLSIGAGYGWYSLSGVLLKEMGGEILGATAFLTNVFRELSAVILIPVLAEKINGYVAIAPAGAASMDTLLPVISASVTPEISLVSFINGAILSFLVPVLVPFFYRL